MKKVKTFHLPHQKGKLSDYWITICDSNVEGTEQDVIKKVLNKRKELH
ncbi:protein of unknown function [Xenorhabdus poinarii G6]|uniref:Uncharacterized protein n=1 Tax=Xenorhabdus poinarii G6 TaxID=1354304 RepID=A0A068R896_9GAMM|nr:protein of unknown function [Xenorhabdus poinarii G6]